jgi:hypothetical protein
MKAAESPGAVAAHGASDRDELRRHVDSELSLHVIFTQVQTYATLLGSVWRGTADCAAMSS